MGVGAILRISDSQESNHATGLQIRVTKSDVSSTAASLEESFTHTEMATNPYS